MTMSEQRPGISFAEEATSGSSAPSPAMQAALARFGIVPADLVGMAPEVTDPEGEREDDPLLAEGHRIVALDVEQPFATVYLTLDDGRYLVYAARLDDEGAILLDSLQPAAPAYDERWIFDDLEGESGPPPLEATPPAGSALDPAGWRAAAGRTLAHIGWYEEGMQVFLHFEQGGYLTFAARASGGIAYLVGAFIGEDPEHDDGYLIFDLPADLDD